MRFTLRIDRLVVDGLPVTHRDRQALGAAVEKELADRLRGDVRNWPSHGVSVRAVRGTTVGIDPARPAGALGTDVAGSIHAALGQAVGR